MWLQTSYYANSIQNLIMKICPHLPQNFQLWVQCAKCSHHPRAIRFLPKCFYTDSQSLQGAANIFEKKTFFHYKQYSQDTAKNKLAKPKTRTQTCNHFTFKLPYLGNISHNIEKELQQFIKKQLPDSKLRFIHTTTKLKHCFHTKDPQSHLRRSNAVYRLNCSSGSFYIGQTQRNLIKRLQEHQTSDTSEVRNHIQSNTDHKVDFNNPQILTHSPDKYKLLILESLFIQQLKPDLNLDSTSFPLHLFNT